MIILYFSIISLKNIKKVASPSKLSNFFIILFKNSRYSIRNSTYNFIVGADGILTVNYNNEIKTTNLTNDDINNITYILKKIYENEDDLIFEGFFDSWTMSICYNHKEIKLNCWHYDSSKNLIDLLKRISPINIDLYGFS